MTQESPLETLSPLITRLFDEAQTAYQRGDRKTWRTLLDQGDKLEAWRETSNPRPPFPDLDWDMLRASAWVSAEEEAILKRLASGIGESEESDVPSDEPDVQPDIPSNEANARENDMEDPVLDTPTYLDPLVAANMQSIQAQVEQHDFTGALAELTRLSKTYPDEPAYQEEWVLTKELQELVRDRLVKQAREESDSAAAFALYQQAIAIDPDSAALYQEEVQILEERLQAVQLEEKNHRPTESLEDKGIIEETSAPSNTEAEEENLIDPETNLTTIKDMVARKEFVLALQTLEQLIDQFPTEPAYEAEITLVKDQQKKVSDTIAKQAEQEKDPARALLLYQKAIEYDPAGESLYQSRIIVLRQRQQDAHLEEDIQELMVETEKRDLSLAHAKSLQERLRGRLDDPAYQTHKTQLEEIEKALMQRIRALEQDAKQLATLEHLGEYDLAIEGLWKLINQGVTTYAETQALPDGSIKISSEFPIVEKLRHLTILSGRVRMEAARKWAERAKDLFQDGYVERAIGLLEDALSSEKGIGTVLEEHAPGVNVFREGLERDLAWYREQLQLEKNTQTAPNSQSQPTFSTEVEGNLAFIRDFVARKEFVSALQTIDGLIEKFPTETAYEAEKTLVKDQQQKTRDATAKQAEQEKDPAKALLLYQKTIEYDPEGESLYQSQMQTLRQRQQDARLEDDIEELKAKAEKLELSLAQAKSLQESLRARLDDPSYISRETQLEEINKKLSLRIRDLEKDAQQMSTMEGLKEYDRALSKLIEMIDKGAKIYSETRALTDGSLQITQEVPIGKKLQELMTLRGGAHLEAARKWAIRASEIMQDGFPERAITLLNDALGREDGIGDVLEEHAPGVTQEKDQLEKTLAKYISLRDRRNQAHELIVKAESAPTQEAISLLKQALNFFPNYPGGQMIIVRREGEIINRVQSDVQKRLGQARRALTKYDPTGAHFDTALEEINTARSNIADLTTTSLTLLRQQQQTLEQRLQTSEELLPEKERELIELTDFIKEREKLEGLRLELDQLEQKVIEQSQEFGQDARFHASMEEKLRRFKEALQKREMALVAQIFDTLTDKEKDHPLGREIITLHDALLGDEQLLVQYEAAYERRDFQSVLDLDLQKFQQRTERPYLRALELRALASFYLRLREIQAMVRRSDFDETRGDTGQVITPGAQAALEDLWQDINSLPGNDQKKAWDECDTLEKNIAQARITRKEEIERRNKISAHVRDASNSMNQGDYPEAWRIFSNAGLPRDNPDIRKFEAELIQKWQRHIWMQVEQAEAGRIPDLTRLFNELQHFRVASLIEAGQEARARALEHQYWTQKARQARQDYRRYAEAKTAWEAALKLIPDDQDARAGLAEIERLLNEQQVARLRAEAEKAPPAETVAKILAAWNANPALKTNLDLINLLLEKRLLAGQLKEIADEINALRFTLPGGGDELFDFWESLVEARQLAAQKRYADALESLDLLKAHSDEFVTAPGQERKRWFLATGNGVYDTSRTEWINHLANQAAQKERAGGDVMEILSAWGQVLRFVPNHVRAGQAVNHHKDILRTVRKDLDDKEKQLVVGSRPPAEMITQSQTLIQEMESILQVLGTLKMDAERMQVKALQDKVRRRIKSIETMTEALSNAQDALRAALGKTFDMSEVRRFLNLAREANPDGNLKPEVLALFEAEFNQADGLLRKVNDTLLNVQRSFTQENFQQVLDQLQVLKDNLLEVNRMLDRLDPTHVEATLSDQMLYVQDPFGIPEKGQGFTYYRRGNIEGAEAIRDEAVVRKNDLKRWQAWVEDAQPALLACANTAEVFLGLLVNGPLKKRPWESTPRQATTPGLTNAQDALARFKSNLVGLRQIQDDLPQNFLSAQAIREVRAKMEESLRAHKRSDNTRLKRMITELAEEGLAGEPVQMRALLQQVLALIDNQFQDLIIPHEADLKDRLARIVPLEQEIDNHASKFGRDRPVADRIVAHVRNLLKQIEALDPAYTYPNEAVLKAAFPDRY